MSQKTQDAKNKRSMELFGKPMSQLNNEEHERLQSYLYDLEHPRTKDIVMGGKITGYKITNTGIVFSRKNANKRKPLKIYESSRGLLYVILKIGKAPHNFYIHDLMAQTFLHNPHGYMYTKHINGNPSINWIRNIEWCPEPTREEKLDEVTIIEDENQNIEEEVDNNMNKELDTQRIADFVDVTVSNNTLTATVSPTVKAKAGYNLNSDSKVDRIINVGSSYTGDQIIKVCDLLEEDQLSISEISRITAVPRYIIQRMSQMGSILGLLEYQ